MRARYVDSMRRLLEPVIDDLESHDNNDICVVSWVTETEENPRGNRRASNSRSRLAYRSDHNEQAHRHPQQSTGNNENNEHNICDYMD